MGVYSREAYIRINTFYITMSAGVDDPALVANATANRLAAQVFEKYERFEAQELLAHTSYHWLLSAEEHRLQVDTPQGLVLSMQPFSQNNCVFAVPVDATAEPWDFREIHQIVRELVIGIYGLNQVPSICLEANFDQGTACHIPPAYNDTRIGQLFINVDYMMKALWHGSFFPKDKRYKFAERWRSNLDVNSQGVPETKKTILNEFLLAGMLDITKDPDFTGIYDNMKLFPMSIHDANMDKKLFMSYVNDMSVQMILRHQNVYQHHNMFLYDGTHNVTSVIKLDEKRIDRDTYERLQTRLQAHLDVIENNMQNKAEIRRQLQLLHFVCFMTSFLIAMRRRNKVPDIHRLLPPLLADDCKTERELPPLMIGPDFKCKNFDFGKEYFHLHGGIQMDIETDEIRKPSEEFVESYEEIELETMQHLADVTDPDTPYHEHHNLPIKTINGKSYYIFAMDFETYYPVAPPQPLWLHAVYDRIKDMKPRRLPLTDVHLHEQFKKKYGLKQAIKFKNIQEGLKICAIRGLVAAFQTLARKVAASRLGKQDEFGLSLLHYAALNNRPQIIQLLLIQGQDINVRRNYNITSVGDDICGGPTPLHLASRCGALEAALCLICNHADTTMGDPDGWAAIHHAAFFDHATIMRLIIRKFEDQTELQTYDKLRQTPLLLAASSGALESVKILIQLGANIKRRDTEGNNMVQLAALRFHTNVLEHFINWNHPDAPVWKTLVGMLTSNDFVKMDSAVRSLEVLTTSCNTYGKSILEADGIPALVNLLRLNSDEMQSLAGAVLCNISHLEDIRRAIAGADAIPILVKLLGSPLDDIQSRSAILLSDLASVDENQSKVSEDNGIPAIIKLFDADLEDVLVEAVNCVRVLCTQHTTNQTLVAQNGGIDPLVEFLQVTNSNILQAAAAAALAALTASHYDNQNLAVSKGVVEPLVKLVKCRNVTVQVKAAAALESLALNNSNSQAAILKLNAQTALIRLLKIWALDVKEQAACTLWALAGHTTPQQRMIAECIGISGIIDLIVKSEKLQYVGCMAMIALTRASIAHQLKFKKEEGILPLVRILRSSKTSERVLLTVIRALGTLCIGVAHCNNKVTQAKIAEEHTIQTLVQLLRASHNDMIKVEIAITLGYIILGNKENEALLKEEPAFNIRLLLQLQMSKDQVVCLKAGTALSTFAFNNTNQQLCIRSAGGIHMATIRRFLDSPNEVFQSYAAFQIVVLARVIVDEDQVTLSALGVTSLVRLLASEDDNTNILAGSLLASLAHTRAGITDAMITSGAVDVLIGHLHSANIEVRSAVAVALGYLTFNRKATRILLVACRNRPGLFEQLMNNLAPDGKISTDFTDEFRIAKTVGLPAFSLEIHGGPPAVPPPRPRTGKLARPQTTMSLVQKTSRRKINPRSASAPALGRKQTNGKAGNQRRMPDSTSIEIIVPLKDERAKKAGDTKVVKARPDL
ncbi:ankyrin and armadillo repeat-containing protein-like isoform X2 [Anneissia japonica]|uniref:ankyrin and armadillo repeat-containing protein-like isoform X2 n=1 Tax=Anneissia japonica TaxID=1529436 RepID=UPI001425629E|nr:ankyrin and armadillo repeat-containing protein-like isoform X2 [Anneissia japonica]